MAFPVFSCFIWHLPLIEWMDVALITHLVINAYQGYVVLATEGVPERWSTLVIKVSIVGECIVTI